jgi:DNA-binding response OmpR family regulator
VPALVLIVEDDPDVTEVLRMALAEDGHRVWTARDAVIALGECATEDPRLILLDLGLPGIDGAEFLRRYRGRGGRAKVIVVSALTNADTRARAIAVDEFIGKPFDVALLQGSVRRLLGEHERA